MIEVREWSEEDWVARKGDWDALLAASGLDPLFLSWDWMQAWWRHFGACRGRELRLLAACRDGALVGIAPLYLASARRRFVAVKSLQFIGTSWRDDSTAVSEYLDFISLPAERDAVRAAFLQAFARRDPWAEFIVSYSDSTASWTRGLGDATLTRDCYARVIEPCTSYEADLARGFESWLEWLGQSTRRSVWHLRRRLEQLGEVRIDAVATHDVAQAFEELNALHQRRWGHPAFSDGRLAFHRDFARAASVRGELAMSSLRVNGAVVSVLYDVCKGGRQYNLKMAFDTSAEQKFSLGLIHLGFALEAAAQRGVQSYDFLAGHGRHTDFKKHLGQRQRELATVQVLRGPLLRRLYAWHDRMQDARRGAA